MHTHPHTKYTWFVGACMITSLKVFWTYCSPPSYQMQPPSENHHIRGGQAFSVIQRQYAQQCDRWRE